MASFVMMLALISEVSAGRMTSLTKDLEQVNFNDTDFRKDFEKVNTNDTDFGKDEDEQAPVQPARPAHDPSSGFQEAAAADKVATQEEKDQQEKEAKRENTSSTFQSDLIENGDVEMENHGEQVLGPVHNPSSTLEGAEAKAEAETGAESEAEAEAEDESEAEAEVEAHAEADAEADAEAKVDSMAADEELMFKSLKEEDADDADMSQGVLNPDFDEEPMFKGVAEDKDSDAPRLSKDFVEYGAKHKGWFGRRRSSTWAEDEAGFGFGSGCGFGSGLDGGAHDFDSEEEAMFHFLNAGGDHEDMADFTKYEHDDPEDLFDSEDDPEDDPEADPKDGEELEMVSNDRLFKQDALHAGSEYYQYESDEDLSDPEGADELEDEREDDLQDDLEKRVDHPAFKDDGKDGNK